MVKLSGPWCFYNVGGKIKVKDETCGMGFCGENHTLKKPRNACYINTSSKKGGRVVYFLFVFLLCKNLP